MAQQIKFGTDGWRAVIADDYTFENVERVAQATAQWLADTRGEAPTVVIGHDARFQGRAFTERAARVLAAEGCQVIFGDGMASTPAVSWATEEFGADAGVVITASHNPPSYNGFKIKADFGGPASPEMIAEVEERIPDAIERGEKLPAFQDLVDDGQITLRDIQTEYVEVLRERIDIDAIKQAGITVAHDAMYGAGQGIVQELLGADNVVALHHDFNPSFHGRAPEPIERNLAELAEAVRDEGCACGLANDGDADRIGMFDENGDFVSSHLLLALLVKYLSQERGLGGAVIKTFSTTHMLDQMGEAYGLEVETTPIGFKYIASKMVGRDVLVGGEESGGIAAKGHIPERDGIYIGLLIVEMMVERGKKLSELVQELMDEFGPHYTYRDDIHTSDAQKKKVLSRLGDEGGLDTVDGHTVERVETLDGYKHVMADRWLLIRPSGTEPVLRVYSEADSAEAAQALVEDAAEQLGLTESAH